MHQVLDGVTVKVLDLYQLLLGLGHLGQEHRPEEREGQQRHIMQPAQSNLLLNVYKSIAGVKPKLFWFFLIFIFY